MRDSSSSEGLAVVLQNSGRAANPHGHANLVLVGVVLHGGQRSQTHGLEWLPVSYTSGHPGLASESDAGTVVISQQPERERSRAWDAASLS